MTLTLEQLDELEARAKAATPGPWRFADWSTTFGTMEDPEHMDVLERNLTHPGPGPYIRERDDGCRQVLRLEWPCENPDNAAHIEANSPDVTLHLVAVYRAALAWSEAFADYERMPIGLETDEFLAIRDNAMRARDALRTALRGAP